MTKIREKILKGFIEVMREVKIEVFHIFWIVKNDRESFYL